MLVRANVSCAYRGEVFAYVDGATAQSSIEVVARETIEEVPDPVDPLPGEAPVDAPGGAPGALPTDDAVDAGIEEGADVSDAEGAPSGTTDGQGGDEGSTTDGDAPVETSPMPSPFEVEPEPVVEFDPPVEGPEVLVCASPRTASTDAPSCESGESAQ